MPGIYAVDTFTASLFAKFFCQFLCDAVDTANGRYNPYLVANAYITVLTLVGLEGTVLFGYAQFLIDGLVGVFKGA